MNVSPVIVRLQHLRATIRHRLVAYGVCAVLAGGMASFLGIVALDWLLKLPSLLRVATAVGFFVGFIYAVMHWVVRPLRASLDLGQVAASLEKHFTILQDRLSSTVNFLESDQAASSEMMQKVVTNTEQVIENLPLESSLTIKPLVARGMLLVLGVSALSAIMMVSPNWLPTGIYRYVYPWGEIEWPRTVEIRPLTLNQKVGVGESLTLRMAVHRGLSDTLRAVVCLRDAEGDVVRRTMKRDRSGTFHATIDAVTADLVYWFEAGDDSTAGHPSAVRVVRRPQVIDAVTEVFPPSYARGRSSWVVDLAEGPVKAPLGGSVRVTIRSTKPIVFDSEQVTVGLRLRSGELLPLTAVGDDASVLTVSFPVEHDLIFRVELIDEDHFENRGAAEYSVLAVPDGPPQVMVREPTAVVDVTPSGVVPLSIQVEDDFGISSLELNVERLGHDSQSISLTDRLERSQEANAVVAVARYAWSMESLAPTPGDTLIYHAVATDNFLSDTVTGQIGRSSPMQIHIISMLEFDSRVLGDLARIETQVRKALLEQTHLFDRTRDLAAEEGESEADTDSQQQLGTVAGRQSRLIRRVRELAGRFSQIVDRMKQNQAGDLQSRQRIEALGGTLRETAVDPMTAAARLLRDAHDQRGPGARRKQLRQAGDQEQRAIGKLRGVLDAMSKWGSFQELVAKTHDLLDRQETLRSETAHIGKATLGQAAETLTASQKAVLRRTVRQQEQLASDVRRLRKFMKQLRETINASDQAGADAIEAAERAANAAGVERHMTDAASAIEANRTAAATLAQKHASDALRRMVQSLRERDDRALEELRKQLDSAEAQIAAIIEHQEALQDAAHESILLASEDEIFVSLAREQRTLARNTSLLAEELGSVNRASVVVGPLQAAAKPMYTAEHQLRELKGVEAALAQGEALALLYDAYDRLSELSEQAAEESFRRTLEQIRENLETIYAAQLAINQEVGPLKAAIEARGRVTRVEARLATKLARAQDEVRSTLEAQLPDFADVAVYRWALQRVRDWMEQSQEQFRERRVDDQLVRITERITHEILKLLDAIVATQALPMDTAFVEGGGGSGEGQDAPTRAIPTVAELLVLKAMQENINQRTDQLRASFDPDQADERTLRELEIVGEDQESVQSLTEKVMERAKNP